MNYGGFSKTGSTRDQIAEMKKSYTDAGYYPTDTVRRLIFRLNNRTRDVSEKTIVNVAARSGVKPCVVSERKSPRMTFYSFDDIKKICKAASERGILGQYREEDISGVLGEITDSF